MTTKMKSTRTGRKSIKKGKNGYGGILTLLQPADNSMPDCNSMDFGTVRVQLSDIPANSTIEEAKAYFNGDDCDLTEHSGGGTDTRQLWGKIGEAGLAECATYDFSAWARWNYGTEEEPMYGEVASTTNYEFTCSGECEEKPGMTAGRNSQQAKSAAARKPAAKRRTTKRSKPGKKTGRASARSKAGSARRKAKSSRKK